MSALEAATGKPPLAAGLAAGVNTLSLDDSVVFTLYVRLVLPLDGYVFWVRADILTPAALMNVCGLNTSQPDAAVALRKTMIVKGSLHYSTQQAQNEAETEGTNTVIFTALAPVQEFNQVASNTLWIGEYAGDLENDDAPITFAFNSRGNYYKQADLFHYTGTAVLPVFRAQLINNLAELPLQPVVSNSLPLWLSLSNYKPSYDGFSNAVPVYPSFLLPGNLQPPYAAVHIEPSATEALQAFPVYDKYLGQAQLAHDRVRVTLYGLSNNAALTFLSAVLQFSADQDTLGMMNMPVVRDDKRTQSELGVIAQRKMIDFEVSYNQQVARQVARRLIIEAFLNFNLEKNIELDFSMAKNSGYLAVLGIA